MATAALQSPYPLRVEATLDDGISRWLWLFKWVLAIPHFIVLAFLWIAYSLLTVVAFFAILFAARYPKAIFEFNVGVLRWTWRVMYYSFGANGTDRYPPFTLAEVPDYPTHLSLEYPERLSRGLVLVKWWLLAIPHYIVVGLLVGGGAWYATREGASGIGWGAGLIGILVLVGVVGLLFTGNYPRTVFDLVLGLNRWVLRVAAYVGLMTDRYPPFRLDMGGAEPSGAVTIPHQPAGGVGIESPVRPDVAGRRIGWTGGRITSLVIGTLVALISVGTIAGGGFLLWADRTQRDAAGFLWTGAHGYATSTYAVVGTATVAREVGGWYSVRGAGFGAPSGARETVRFRVTPVEQGVPIFVGIGPADGVNSYLNGVARAQVEGGDSYTRIPGGAPADWPRPAPYWTVLSSGTGTQNLNWVVTPGTWSIVIMNADGSPGVAVRAAMGARLTALPWIAVGLLIAGGILLAVALALIVVPIARASRR